MGAHSVKGIPLRNDDVEELRERFSDLLNYDEEDLHKPIDPLCYRTPEGDTCLHISARRSDIRAITLLLKFGVDIDAPGDMGYTALHDAVSAGNAEVVSYLLNAGASTQPRNDLGQTAEDLARHLGLSDILRLCDAHRVRGS